MSVFESALAFYHMVYKYTKPLNESKYFAGIIIIIINFSSKFVDVRLSKPMESYFKNTFSRQMLVFAIAWMPTRDIFVAFIVSALVIFCVDFLMNDDSMFCVLPESFTTYHREIEEGANGQVITQQDVTNMNKILDKIALVMEKTGGVSGGGADDHGTAGDQDNKKGKNQRIIIPGVRAAPVFGQLSSSSLYN